MQLLKLNLGSKFAQDEIIKNQSNYLITILHIQFPVKITSVTGKLSIIQKAMGSSYPVCNETFGHNQ